MAIALVLVHRVVRGFYVTEDAYSQSATRYGAFGVDIFFGLSGLLITKLLLEEWHGAGAFQLPQFYIRRVFRILPPYLVFLAVVTAFGWWSTKLEFTSSLFFFRNYLPQRLAGPYTGHLWSLAVEEHFYLIWPGLLALSGARRSRTVAAGLALGLRRMANDRVPVRPASVCGSASAFSKRSAHGRAAMGLPDRAGAR